jgi:signal peptidase II
VKKKSILAISVIFLVLLIDQALKIYIKTHFLLGDEYKIFGFERALLHFVENPGMAFGIEIGGSYGKLALSLFRILAIAFLVYYINLLVKADEKASLIISFSLILAGAMGNIIDSAFYGMIFSASMPSFHGGELAKIFPPEGGYGSFLHGNVVDMFYFPLFEGVFPAWLPIWGGETYLFFRPVFNVADAAITTGVIALILFNRSFFGEKEMVEQKKSTILETQAKEINDSINQ